MRTVRARLVALTLLLLVQQAVALGLATALACCAPDVSQGEGMECCAKGEAGHMCPVANRRAADAGCRIRRGCEPADAGMLAGAGFVYAAPLVDRFVFVAPFVASVAPDRFISSKPVVPVSPPSPPPKA